MSKDYKKYWTAQAQLVQYLLQLGILLPINLRISPFRLRLDLDKIIPDGEIKIEVFKLIDELVKLRIEGDEPNHTNGLYV